MQLIRCRLTLNKTRVKTQKRAEEINTGQMEEDGTSIWPRMEPFMLGALPVAPSSKLSLHYLRKMATYCSSTSELDQQKNKLSVDTLQFILFLFVQQLNRVSLRSSSIVEEWPSHRTRSPSPSTSDREGKTSCQNKNWDDQAHLSFINGHLGEILELLVEPGQLSRTGQALRDCQISLEEVQSLSLLLEGSSQGTSVQPVYRLLTKCPLQNEAGYCTKSQSFPLHKLLLCLQQNLSLNPFGITACLQSGKKLAWAQQVEGAMKRAKVARNTHTAPLGSKIVLMSQVLKQTLAKTSEKLAGTNLKIHRCADSFIYLLSPLRSVTVDKCPEFHTLVVPFEMEGDTSEIPGGLPPLYQEAVEEKRRRIKKWQKTVTETRLNKAQTRQFQSLVEMKFHEWLLETGNRLELDSLLPPCSTQKTPNCQDPNSLKANGNRIISNGQSKGQSTAAY
uniref:Uncharacterized protein n=1 Tax=Knipowitschia caucasica TaxID=637954 RepID=A0AAV2K0U7_KNICA